MPKQSKSNIQPLVDNYAEVDAKYKTYKAERERLREDILATGLELLAGTDDVITVSDGEKKLLDRALLEEKFGVDAVAACVVKSGYKLVKVKPRAKLKPRKK